MELTQILQVLRRWAAVIVGVIVVITLGIFLNLRSTPTNYSSSVKLQLTAPDRDDVRLVDEYRYVNQREEATLAQNNYTEIAKSREVYRATQEILNLPDEAMDYTLEVTPIHDSDFVIVKFTSPNEENLIEIANVHVVEAIKHLGNTRALSSEASSSSFSIQLAESVENLEKAEAELAAFQSKHEIIALDSEIQIEERVIENLEIEKARLILEASQDANTVTLSQNTIASLEAQINAIEVAIQEEILNQLVLEQTEILSEDAIPEELTASQRAELNKLTGSIADQAEELQKLRLAKLEEDRDLLIAQLETLKASGVENQAILEIEKLISESRIRLATLLTLEPEYNILKANTSGALETYELVLEKYNEAQVRAEVNRGATFVQVVNQAFSSSVEPNPMIQFIVMGFAASFVLGILIAFLLEYFFPGPPNRESKRSSSSDTSSSDQNINVGDVATASAIENQPA